MARIWMIGRLPALIAVAYFGRQYVLDLFERLYDLAPITEAAIDLLGTPLTRMLHLLLLVLVLALSRWAGRSMDAKRRYLVILTVAGIWLTMLVAMFQVEYLAAVIALVITATNLAPDAVLDRAVRRQRVWRPFLIFGIGIAELLFLRRFVESIWPKAPGTNSARNVLVHGAPYALVAFVVTLALHGQQLAPIETALRSSPGTVVVDRGNFNQIALDATGGYLFVVGHGLDQPRRYTLGEVPPRRFDAVGPSWGAQAFAYDAEAREIYVYDSQEQLLRYFDSVTFTQKRSVPIPGVAIGDVWIAVDRPTNTVAIASEMDEPDGASFVVVDRTSGETLDRQSFDAGNLLKHPSEPYVYISSFRRSPELKLYDLKNRRVIRQVVVDRRSHRMSFSTSLNEVLLASSIEGRVQRFHATTLEPRGQIPVPFGTRSVAVDDKRQLVLSASSTGGHLSVIRLDSGQTVARHYLGPWLRTIELDVAAGVAYVSSNGAIYRMRYAPPSGPGGG